MRLEVEVTTGTEMITAVLLTETPTEEMTAKISDEAGDSRTITRVEGLLAEEETGRKEGTTVDNSDSSLTIPEEVTVEEGAMTIASVTTGSKEAIKGAGVASLINSSQGIDNNTSSRALKAASGTSKARSNSPSSSGAKLLHTALMETTTGATINSMLSSTHSSNRPADNSKAIMVNSMDKTTTSNSIQASIAMASMVSTTSSR